MQGSAGSFWAAFGVKFGSVQSAIDEILERDSFQLQELLDHDDIIQECKYLNSTLIDYLSRPDTLEQLIKYIIMIPPEEGKETKEPVKYPYLASELFACEVVSMLETLFEHPKLLELLFSFLDQKPPLDPSSAGYFRKVVVVLIQRKYEPLVRYIHENKLIQKLVDHIGLYSIMELLIMIGWDDGLGQVNDVKWLYEEKLVPRLVSKLDPTYDKEEEIQVNAARALVDVVVKCPPTQTSLLVSHLQSASILERIFRYMFSGSRSSLTNCLSIIIVLVQRDANRRSELQDEHEYGLPPIIEQVLKHLPQLATLLTKTPDASHVLKTQYGQLNPPLGETRMKAVELFLVLFRSNYADVNQQLYELKVMPAVLDLFFQYEWNNMLHGLVESIIRTILESESIPLKQSLFSDGKFVDRVLAAYKKNEEQLLTRPPSSKKGGFRIGYMGHLVRTCGAIAYIFNQDAKLKSLLGDQQKEWDDFVAGALAKDNESHNALLGGAAPAFAHEEEDPYDGVAVGLSDQQKDDDDFQFGDDDDAYGSSAYPLRQDDDEEFNEDSIPVQYSSDWAYGGSAGAGGAAGAGVGVRGGGIHHDDDDDSSDEDSDRLRKYGHAAQLQNEKNSSDEEEDSSFDPRAIEAAKAAKDSIASESASASESESKSSPASNNNGSDQAGASAIGGSISAPLQSQPQPQPQPSQQPLDKPSSPTAEDWAKF